MRWILRSLAIAVAGFVLATTAPPVQAQQTMTAAQQASLTTAIAANDAPTIASLAVKLSGPALASLATYLVDSNNATLIADVMANVKNLTDSSGTAFVGKAIGVAIANSPNAITLGPAVITLTADNWAAVQSIADGIITTSTNRAVVKATQYAAAQAGITLLAITLQSGGGIVLGNAPPVPPPCTTSCT